MEAGIATRSGRNGRFWVERNNGARGLRSIKGAVGLDSQVDGKPLDGQEYPNFTIAIRERLS